MTAAELEVETAQAALGDPAVMADRGRMAAAATAAAAAQSKVDALYARWQTLDAKRAAAEA